MTRIGKMSPIWAFLIGAFWINTTLVVAAAVDTLRAELSNRESIAGVRGVHARHAGGAGGADPLLLSPAQAGRRRGSAGSASGSRGTRRRRSR